MDQQQLLQLKCLYKCLKHAPTMLFSQGCVFKMIEQHNLLKTFCFCFGKTKTSATSTPHLELSGLSSTIVPTCFYVLT